MSLSPPRNTELSVAELLFFPTSQRLQQSPGTEGHSSPLLSGPAQQHPTGLSSSIITGNFNSVSCWALPPRAFESEGLFFPPSKELITFTTRCWNLWTELSHSSAKLGWFHLPHSRKLAILQLPFLFSCLNHLLFLQLHPHQHMASKTGDKMAVAKGCLQSCSKQEGTSPSFQSLSRVTALGSFLQSPSISH